MIKMPETSLELKYTEPNQIVKGQSPNAEQKLLQHVGT